MASRRENHRNRFKGIPEPHAVERREKVKGMRLEGRTVAQIAAELRATVSTIKADCSTLRSQGSLPKYNGQRLVIQPPSIANSTT